MKELYQVHYCTACHKNRIFKYDSTQGEVDNYSCTSRCGNQVKIKNKRGLEIQL